MPEDIMPLRRIDHVRFFVGNARQSAYFYRNAFGFQVVAYAGLDASLHRRRVMTRYADRLQELGLGHRVPRVLAQELAVGDDGRQTTDDRRQTIDDGR